VPVPLCGFLIQFLLIALMMEAASTSETLVNFYHTIQRYNPEDSQTRRSEILKSRLFYRFIFHQFTESANGQMQPIKCVLITPLCFSATLSL
jgi:hypothetical protein